MLKFVALTYSATWTCFAIAALSSRSVSMREFSALHTGLLLLGTFAPSLVALGLTWLDQGASGARGWLRPVLLIQAPMRWYLFAVAYLLTIKLAAALMHRVIVGSWPAFGTTPWGVIAVAIVLSTPVQAGEEIGWRGYALPRLANRFGLARASLILGLMWACWHLPLFFVPGHPDYGQSFPTFVVGGIALSVAIAWLYANSNGSVLLPMLMHSAVNQTNGVVPTRLPRCRKSLCAGRVTDHGAHERASMDDCRVFLGPDAEDCSANRDSGREAHERIDCSPRYPQRLVVLGGFQTFTTGC